MKERGYWIEVTYGYYHNEMYHYTTGKTMTQHPAHKMGYEALMTQLEAHADQGRVSRKIANDNPNLATFCYTKAAVHEGNFWDDALRSARGIVVNLETKQIVATPFPKFFNYGEHSYHLPNEQFTVYEKLDGSLIIAYHDGNRWRANTKGSFESEQAQWAERWLKENGVFGGMVKGVTYLLEAIYPENRIVVPYSFSGCVLLSAYTANGYEITALTDLAERLGVMRAKAYHYDSFNDILVDVKGFKADREGYVIRFDDGYRVKVKGEEYLRIHRLASKITPLGVWGAMSDGMDLTKVRMELPEEFYEDFDALKNALVGSFDGIVSRVNAAVAAIAHMSNKEIGLSIYKCDKEVAALIFHARKLGDGWEKTERPRTAILRMIRPTGDELASAAEE